MSQEIDLIIQGGEVVLPNGELRYVDILISDGRIAGLVTDANHLAAKKRIDASGLLVMPGGVDPHVHFGITNPRSEDYVSESIAAAAGGVTTIINYDRVMGSYRKIVPEWRTLGEQSFIIDFGFHLGMFTREHLAELEMCVREFGITSFKFFMSYKGVEKSKFNSDTLLDDGFMFQVLKRFAALPERPRLCVHCENMELTRAVREDGVAGEGLLRWHRLRPGISEAESMQRVLYLARVTGAAVYIVHLSARESVELLRQGAANGADAIIETCPHYLSLTVNSEAGLLAKVNPPVREQADADALWGAMHNGLISVIGSDHVPRYLHIKQGQGDLTSTTPGFPGVSTTLPLLLTDGLARGFTLGQLSALFSTNPARVFGLAPRKGSLVPGSDADLVLVDLATERTVQAANLPGSSGYTPYEGRRLRGWPVRTLVRGQTVYADGAPQVEPGYGAYLVRN